MEKTGQVLNWDSIMPFGKHKGRTVREVTRNDPKYITWAHEVTGLCFDKDVLWASHIAEENIRLAEEELGADYDSFCESGSYGHDDIFWK